MIESLAYQLRFPLPSRSEAIGPSDWSDRDGQALSWAALYPDLATAAETITAAMAASAYQRAADPSLLFIHADWLVAQGEWADLAGFLGRIVCGMLEAT